MSDRASDRHGGLYEETGLFTGPSAAWGAGHGLSLVPTVNAQAIASAWARVCEDLHPLEGHFGHEGRVPRPRAQDSYYAVSLAEAALGLAWLQRPYPGIRAYGFGLFPEARRQGHGVCVKRALLTRCFSDPHIHRVECEVYSSNVWSLRVLHGPGDPMAREGVQREVMALNGRYYDRVLFGITRSTWEAIA